MDAVEQASAYLGVLVDGAAVLIALGALCSGLIGRWCHCRVKALLQRRRKAPQSQPIQQEVWNEVYR